MRRMEKENFVLFNIINNCDRFFKIIFIALTTTEERAYNKQF